MGHPVALPSMFVPAFPPQQHLGWGITLSCLVSLAFKLSLASGTFPVFPHHPHLLLEHPSSGLHLIIPCDEIHIRHLSTLMLALGICPVDEWSGNALMVGMGSFESYLPEVCNSLLPWVAMMLPLVTQARLADILQADSMPWWHAPHSLCWSIPYLLAESAALFQAHSSWLQPGIHHFSRSPAPFRHWDWVLRVSMLLEGSVFSSWSPGGRSWLLQVQSAVFLCVCASCPSQQDPSSITPQSPTCSVLWYIEHHFRIPAQQN